MGVGGQDLERLDRKLVERRLAELGCSYSSNGTRRESREIMRKQQRERMGDDGVEDDEEQLIRYQ